MTEIVAVSLLNGIVYGLLLFMLTSGLTLIFSMMGVLNFAHASVFMLGAYFSFQIGRWIGFWPALVIAPLLCATIGAAIERYGLRHVHKSGHVAEILFTFGLAYVIVLHAQGIRVLRVLRLFRRQRPAVAPVLPAQPDPGDAAEAPVL